MKKPCTVILCIFWCFAASVGFAEAQNLIANPDFAGSAPGKAPQNWRYQGKDVNYEVVESGDGFAMRLSSEKKTRGFVVQNRVPVKNGGTYAIGVRYRGKPGARVWYYVERGKPQWSGCIRLVCREYWQISWQKVKIPMQGTAPHVAMVLMDGNGWCEFTDPQIIEFADPANGNLLLNADFSVTASVGGKTVPVLWNALNNAEVEVLTDGDGKLLRMNCIAGRSHLTQWSLPVVKGKSYILSMKYRGAPGAGMLFGVERGKPYWKQLKRIKCTDKWQRAEVRFTVPAGAGGVPYAVFSTDPGDGYVELAELKLLPAEE
jgi:hypothetical protein